MKHYERLMKPEEVRKLENPRESLFFLKENLESFEKRFYTVRVTIVVHEKGLPLRNRINAAVKLIKDCLKQVLVTLRG